ncbi:MAG: glycosyltransferase [Rhizobiales bacterium]|nr:glycosyltransferase [Hyphomicrobiales bacterium]
MLAGRKALIVVENLTLPLDRRVWQEATALRDAGCTVSVICPKGGKYQAAYECLEGIHIFRHPLPLEADGPLGYALEYGSALFWETLPSFKVKRKIGFDVIQACNPPDTIFLLAGLHKALFGTPFVFDHHDINPELYEAKFGKRGFFHELLLRLERLTFRTADVSIATNETFKRIAIERGGMSPDDVYVVRSIPDLARFKRANPRPALRNGRRNVLGYVGIMGAQDGVDLLIEAMAHLVHVEARNDTQCVIVGSGTELEKLEAMSRRLGLEDHVTFTGFLSGTDLMETLSTFDIGAIPDPKNVYNDKISMNKVFEYMSLGIPFVQFDLSEGRKIAGDACLYAGDNDPAELARQIARLADDEGLRAEMSAYGMARAAASLDWERERDALLAAYSKALAPAGRGLGEVARKGELQPLAN